MSDHGLELSVGKEIRFAVVMYGGVSLAIYINGVAQELLKMCRATDGGRKYEDLKADEKVYRQIAFLLADENRLKYWADFLSAAEIPDDSERVKVQAKREREAKTVFEDFIKNDDLEMTRLLVDILTGTSAGGINAIFLAKALANNQEIEQLKELWLSEGDISVLINDKYSVDGISLSRSGKARSLLNSNRMYLKLLEAFDGMGGDLKQGEKSPYVEDLDLFVPTTDFEGTVVPLRLLDDVIEEKRFRQVFHFRYQSDGTNDFEKKNNAMLAVAARATSSFPFAFEPMRLSQAENIIAEAFSDAAQRNADLKTASEKFFPKIVQKNGQTVQWQDRDLVDGGVLDNKPFGYAIDVLSKRRADFRVERKLLYIEPSPESFSKKNNSNQPPDVLQNAAASLSAIPGYETIREDLERLLERNKLIERVNRLITSSENDVFEFLTIFGNREENAPNSGKVWEELGLEDIVRWKGRTVLTYYRLRIAELTDDLAKLVARMIGVTEESEYFQTIRTLVRIWRDDNYSNYKGAKKAGGAAKPTILAFLRVFDLNYRLRRLRLVQQKANALYDFDAVFEEDFKIRHQNLAKLVTETQEKARKTVRNKKDPAQMEKAEKAGSQKLEEHPFVEKSLLVSQSYLEQIEQPETISESVVETDEPTKVEIKPTEVIWTVYQQKEDGKISGKEQIRLAAGYFQIKLKKVYKDLLQQREKLLFEPTSFSEALKNIQIAGDELAKLQSKIDLQSGLNVGDLTDEKMLENLKSEFQGLFSQIQKASEELQKVFDQTFEAARQEARKILSENISEIPFELRDKGVDPVLLNAVRGFLEHYYENFDDYDQISFPIYYQTLTGEAVKVDVMRISPQDAKLLNGKMDRKKVAGEKLFHFGAFLDRVWRKNDIMWGRLDGAERLITALLPDKKYEKLREFFTKQAHEVILKNEFLEANKEELRGELAKSLIKVSAGLPLRDVIAKVTQDIDDEAVKNRLIMILGTLFDGENSETGTESQIYDYVKNYYQYEERLEPQNLLQVISRSTKVTGDIFEGIAEDRAQAGSRLRWIARLGQVFWGLVEVAAPDGFLNKLFTHWLYILYLFEAVLIIGSTIFVKPETQQFGIVSLILTLIIHLTAVALYDYMKGEGLWALFKFIAFGFFVLLTILGGLFVYAFFYDPKFWGEISWLQGKLAGFGAWFRLLPVILLLGLFAATFGLRTYRKYKAGVKKRNR
jgi:patatin-related protein